MKHIITIIFIFFGATGNAVDLECGLCGEYDGILFYNNNICKEAKSHVFLKKHMVPNDELVVKISCPQKNNFFGSNNLYRTNIEVLSNGYLSLHKSKIGFLDDIYLIFTHVTDNEAYYSGEIEKTLGNEFSFELKVNYKDEDEIDDKIFFFTRKKE